MSNRFFYDVDAPYSKPSGSVPIDQDERIAELEKALKLDKTGLAAGLAEVNKLVDGYWWITEGRGPYTDSDDEYRKETGYMLEAIRKAATKALNESGQLVNETIWKSSTPSRPSWVSVVKELVELKDMVAIYDPEKESFEEFVERSDKMVEDCNKRYSLAWAAARELLKSVKQP